jgi:hypothetical protein
MSHEFDRTRIEECISQARQKRVKHMAVAWGPAFKNVIGALFLLLAAMLPLLRGGPRS